MKNYEQRLREQVGQAPLFVPWVWALVQDDENHLLLAIRDVSLELPGWPMEIGEQFQDTLARGLQTVGLTPEKYRIEKSLTPITSPRIREPQGEVQTLDIGYLVTVVGTLPKIRQEDYCWLDQAKLRQQQLAFNSSLPLLQQYLKELPRD